MPGRRAFDWDLLRKLVTNGPTLSDYELAQKLTEDNEANNRDLPPVNKSTVRTVLERNRETWAVPLRNPSWDEVRPPAGTLAPEHDMDTPIRYLRDLAAEKAGVVPSVPQAAELRSSALGWAQRMRQGRTVVDLDTKGTPVVREARAEELNSKGELISLMAWRVPGWRDAKPL
jgi:hypothetical protein